MSPSGAGLLLPTYVGIETLRAVLTFGALNYGVRFSSTLVMFYSELSKLLFTSVFLRRHILTEHDSLSIRNIRSAISISRSRGKPPWKAYSAFAVPSLLYLINNILYLLAIQLTTPALLHIAISAKLPFTAVLHHYLVLSQRNPKAWLSLGMLCMSLLVTYVPPGWSSWLWQRQVGQVERAVDGSSAVAGALFGSLLGLGIAALSGFTSTYTEIVLKQDTPFWVTQFWLYCFGSIFSAIAYAIWDGKSHRPRLELTNDPLTSEPNPFQTIMGNILIILSTAATGLVVAMILRKKDNLVKLVGSSTSIITILVAQCLLFQRLRDTTFNFATVLGVGGISISTWTYHFYKERREQEYSLIDSEVSSNSEFEADLLLEDMHRPKQESTAPTPTPKRITAAITVTLIIAILTGVFQMGVSTPNSEHTIPDSDEGTMPQLPNHDLLHNPPSQVDDIERFFTNRNITPTAWGHIQPSTACITDWLDRENVYPISPKFTDWANNFPGSGCPVYPVPSGGIIFHQYWSGKWRPFNEVNIEAWLATQRLGDGHRLIYWYENGKPPNSVLRRFGTGAYGRHVEFREFNRTKEAKGTCVADMPEWKSEAYRTANQMRIETLSDIVRNLLLSKYGGFWLDADTIPMRDLTPLIRSGPSALGIGEHDWNNNVLIFGPPNTTVTQRVLETTCSLTINRTLYMERYGKDAIIPREWYWMWNDAFLKMCASKANCGLSRIPVYFNDGWSWMGKGQMAMKPCQSYEQWYGPSSILPLTLRTIFAWHPRLGQYSDDCVERNGKTLVAAARRRIDQLLSYGLDMNGRDLFPGPVLTT